MSKTRQRRESRRSASKTKACANAKLLKPTTSSRPPSFDAERGFQNTVAANLNAAIKGNDWREAECQLILLDMLGVSVADMNIGVCDGGLTQWFSLVEWALACEAYDVIGGLFDWAREKSNDWAWEERNGEGGSRILSEIINVFELCDKHGPLYKTIEKRLELKRPSSKTVVMRCLDILRCPPYAGLYGEIELRLLQQDLAEFEREELNAVSCAPILAEPDGKKGRRRL